MEWENGRHKASIANGILNVNIIIAYSTLNVNVVKTPMENEGLPE